jgi:hypothetical protein
MSTTLTTDDLKHFETFVTTCLSDPESMTHEELLEAIQVNQELCTRALHQLQGTPDRPDVEHTVGAVSEADLNFLQSWLKAKNLMLGGLQLLQLADPENAATVQHELECTETAFVLLPGLISEARGRL